MRTFLDDIECTSIKIIAKVEDLHVCWLATSLQHTPYAHDAVMAVFGQVENLQALHNFDSIAAAADGIVLVSACTTCCPQG
jgi:pyruvate kinase